AAIHWHDPLPISLAATETKALRQMHVIRREVRDLGCPAAGRIEQFQERPIAPPERIAGGWAHEQLLDGLDREHLRHSMPKPLAPEQFGQIVAEHALQLQIAKEDLER